jgi:predicted RNase H-like HicB family nuclease
MGVIMEAPKYTVVIHWSDRDQCYIADLPEWGPGCSTHGQTYEAAAANAHEALELLVRSHDQRRDGPLPPIRAYRPGDLKSDVEPPVTAHAPKLKTVM